MLVAKHDLVARCIHRLQTNRIIVGEIQPAVAHRGQSRYTPKNLPAAAEEPPRRSCFALGGYSRFSGVLALRHSVGLRLTHALRVVVFDYL